MVSLPFATGIKLIQIYYLAIVSQVANFSIKEGSEILVAPFESSTQLTELNFHPLFNFDPQKVLWLLIHF